MIEFVAAGVVFAIFAKVPSDRNMMVRAEDRSTLALIGRMKDNGFLVGYPSNCFGGSRPASVYEAAVSIYSTVESLESAGSKRSKSEWATFRKQLQLNKRDFDQLRFTAMRFKVEFAALGADSSELATRIQRLAISTDNP